MDHQARPVVQANGNFITLSRFLPFPDFINYHNSAHCTDDYHSKLWATSVADLVAKDAVNDSCQFAHTLELLSRRLKTLRAPAHTIGEAPINPGDLWGSGATLSSRV